MHNFIKRNSVLIFIGLVVILLILIVFFPFKKNYNWNTDKPYITIPFRTNVAGSIYIQSKIGENSGHLFIDTGADITGIKESLLNKNDSTFRQKLTDAQKIVARKKLIKAKSIKIGDLEFPHLNVWPMDNESWLKSGVFYQQDSVIGILGSDILKQFVWDFNMKEQEITIYNPPYFPENISDSIAVPLSKKGKGYYVEIEVKGKKYPVQLDTGCSSCLSLKDTLSNSTTGLKGSYHSNHSTFFSHLRNKSLSIDSNFVVLIPELKLGKSIFSQVITNEKAKNNLLGVPFFWAFERVIIDYPNLKIYFINRAKNNKRSVQSKSSKSVTNMSFPQKGYLIINQYASFATQKIVHTEDDKGRMIKDTVPSEYQFHGKSKLWGDNFNSIDSITSLDSVRLPNGKIEYANYTFNTKNKFFIEY